MHVPLTPGGKRITLDDSRIEPEHDGLIQMIFLFPGMHSQVNQVNLWGCNLEPKFLVDHPKIATSNKPSQNETILFQPSIFRFELLEFREGSFSGE